LALSCLAIPLFQLLVGDFTHSARSVQKHPDGITLMMGCSLRRFDGVRQRAEALLCDDASPPDFALLGSLFAARRAPVFFKPMGGANI